MTNFNVRDPHVHLGLHEAERGESHGTVVRAFHPDAQTCGLVRDDELRPMRADGAGLFSVFLPEELPIFRYRLRFGFGDGSEFERGDPYRFLPTLGEMDVHLISEGTHHQLWNVLGAHGRCIDGERRVSFAVWAPNAEQVSVVGDFNGWDGRLLPMRALGSSGVWELFVPDVRPGALYKYEIRTHSGTLRLKADPLAQQSESEPGTASRVFASAHEWHDSAWLAERARQNLAREPLLIYEVHLGSWARVPEEQGRMLTYRELALALVPYVKRFGFTHLELMPIAEHAYYPSWGYQVTGYYAPTSRYGSSDDFRYFVDYCHQNGIGILMDWVPAHFPRDDFALRQFDGTALYEHADPRRGEHPDWGTLIFNYDRREVRNFLIANALYWLNEFHIDGLRFDAVASMLYLDFSRREGQWLPNAYGGRENLEAVSFLQELNRAVHEGVSGAFTVAEESTAWPGITRSPADGGLGFDFKWNMGWMHDTLHFFEQDPLYRKYQLGSITFAMVYEYSEHFINAISHDEVVYGKRSLVEKMPGDFWQKLANLRLLLAYQYSRPGKVLSFMGGEFAQSSEWNVDRSLDFHLARDATHAPLVEYVAALGKLYSATPALWRCDIDPEGFEWIDCTDAENTIVSYIRRDGPDYVIVILNFTPVPRNGYRVGVPPAAAYEVRLSSDDPRFGGSGLPVVRNMVPEPKPWQGRSHSMHIDLPPLGALFLVPA